MKPVNEQTLVEKLRTRTSIRRNIKDRKSVQEGKPDRIAELLEEAADEIEELEASRNTWMIIAEEWRVKAEKLIDRIDGESK